MGSLDATLWTTIEANTAIICACLPAWVYWIKQLVKTIKSTLFPGAHRSDSVNLRGINVDSANLGGINVETHIEVKRHGSDTTVEGSPTSQVNLWEALNDDIV